MVLVPGGHNSERPKFCLDSIAIFLRTSMRLDPAVRACVGVCVCVCVCAHVHTRRCADALACCPVGLYCKQGALPDGPTLFQSWSQGGGGAYVRTTRFDDLEEQMIRRAMAASLNISELHLCPVIRAPVSI